MHMSKYTASQKRRFFLLWGPLTRKLSKSDTNDRHILFQLGETNPMVYRKTPKSISTDTKEYPSKFQIKTYHQLANLRGICITIKKVFLL